MEPPAQFSISLLGPVEVLYEQQPVQGYESVKALALLCYLVTRDQPVSRQALVSLFWPDKDEARGRNNLSVVLHNLGSLLPGLLAADRQTVGLAHHVDCWRDMWAFTDLVHQPDTPALAAAEKLYRGEFLEGLYLKDCPEFDLWLTTEREAWRQQIRQVLHRLTQHAYDQQAYTAGQAHAARLLELDPLDEAAHRQMMRLLTALDQRSTALEQYRTCCHLLETELNVQPTEETTSLYHQIRTGTLRPSQPEKAAAEPPALPHNLPHPMTAFVGRTAELSQIAKALHDTDCRLLTLTGLGGVGKTRLALQAARQCLTGQPAYPDGVWFVSLAGVESPDHIIMTLASTLPFYMQGKRDMKDQVLGYLGPRRLLLLLDNMEHLLDARDLVAEILATAPDVTMLCTSRERLNIPAEWVVEIRGLDLPSSDDALANSSDYSAIQLFAQRARQVQSSFALTQANQAAVARICRNVEGVPLAIELAASWVNVLPCEAIVEELESTLAILATRQHLVPERHQSMHAVFDHSWQLLSPQEQEALLALSVFRGGFLRDAAEAVAGASLPLLATLLDKSLLRCDEQGRYSMHELLRHYAGQQLAEQPELHERVCTLHSDYWLTFLHQHRSLLNGPHEQVAIDAVGANIENIRVAWQYAIDHCCFDSIDGAMLTLTYYYYVSGCLLEGEHVYVSLTAALRQALAEEPNDRAPLQCYLGKALTYQGTFLVIRGRYRACGVCLEQAIDLLDTTSPVWERGLALYQRGNVAMLIGDYTQAIAFSQEALEMGQAMDDAWIVRGALYILARAAEAQGNLAEAVELFTEILTHYSAGNEFLTGMDFCQLAHVYHAQGRRTEAHEMFHQSLAICTAINHPVGTAMVRGRWGDAYANEENYSAALVEFRASVEISREMGDNWELARVLAGLGYALLAVGNDTEARHCFGEAVEFAVLVDSRSELLDALLGIARLAAHDRHDRLAFQLVHLVQQHPASHYMTRNRARHLLASLSDHPELAAVNQLADPATADLIQLARDAQHWLGVLPLPDNRQ